MDISIVIPVYNSGNTLPQLHKLLAEVMTINGYNYEIIFVDDHCQDNSLPVLQSISAIDPNVKVLTTKKNAGQVISTLSGIKRAKYDMIITLDDDLQYSPDEIPKLVTAFNQGEHIIVFGRPEIRSSDIKFNSLRTLAQTLYDSFILRSHRKVHYFSSYRIFSKLKLAEFMPRGMNIYFIWEIPPDRITFINVQHRTSARGKSNYNIIRFFKFFKLYIFYALYRFSWVMIIISLILLLPISIMAIKNMDQYRKLFVTSLFTSILSIFCCLLFGFLVARKRNMQFDHEEI